MPTPAAVNCMRAQQTAEVERFVTVQIWSQHAEGVQFSPYKIDNRNQLTFISLQQHAYTGVFYLS